MLRKLHQELQDGPIVILYFHTCVQSGDNSPGILRLRRIYESLPQPLKLRLEAVYIVHPGIRSRLFLATLGRFFLSEGLEFLCDFVKDGQVEVPEFVWEHDQELESRPLMDYGLDVDPLQYNNMDAVGPPHSRLSFR
ncbi:hypothetical protein CY35_15G015400 [Sphagnum magellanicum]|nr:hypothetical protein CY35_15G015400 [Sphagnum magellanicum]KAH9538607.1 hypothetical protein CY35_15G015400 [Sphagnum magellanicum]